MPDRLVRSLVPSLAAALLIAALLPTATPAQAGQIDFGVTHERPNPAIDEAANGYFKFADGKVLKFCKAPAGGSRCATTKTFPEYKSLPQDFGPAASPLARGTRTEERVAAARGTLREAVAAAFGDSPDQRLQRELVERGYLDPAGSHARAMLDLNVSRTTCFRRLAEGSERVASHVLASRG